MLTWLKAAFGKPTSAVKTPAGKTATGAAAAGIALAVTLIVHWEGEDLVAVHNSFDPPGVITVCNGITNYDLPTLKVGDKFTREECKALLALAIPKYRAPLVECVLAFESMPPNRQAALISASFNLGPDTICKSTAVRKLNAGDAAGGCEALGRFVKANGKVLKGLLNRRRDPEWGEITWCLRSD